MRKIIIFALAFVCTTVINAELAPVDHGHESDHNTTAHQHGLAEITLSLEGNRPDNSLSSPAANIVGIEHKPINDEQIKAAEAAHNVLESTDKLFHFIGSECISQFAQVNMATLFDIEQNDDHSHPIAAQNNNIHSEVSATYRFNCDQGDKLNAVSVALMHSFVAIKSVNVRGITDLQQDAVQLTDQSTMIRIR